MPVWALIRMGLAASDASYPDSAAKSCWTTYHTARLRASRDPDAANGVLNSWRPEIDT